VIGGFVVRAPGRVNLIGDHTDYTGGLVLPMTIDRWTIIEGESSDGAVELTSADEPDPLSFSLPVAEPASVAPSWGRYVAAVAAELGTAARPFRGRVTSDIPIGAGLSSSAALEVAAALALGFDGSPVALAELTRRAEHRASGVPCGIMDQLCIASGVADHALLIDCGALTTEPVPLPTDVALVIRFVARRTLAGSEYADRVAECAAIEARIGPLRTASIEDVDALGDPVLRRRARHVVTENERVRQFADALRDADLGRAGRLMIESHASLRDDFETSTAVMDAAVAQVCATPGVHGARMTGGGFGGCIVALVEPAAELDGWRVRAVDGAARADRVTVLHLMPAEEWERQATTASISSPSLASEGFIHCTDDPKVLVKVANSAYRHLPGDFVVLHIDVAKLTSRCVWEEPAHVTDPDEVFAPRFPHVYGPIDRAAVLAVQPARRDSSGRFIDFGERQPST
jgi:galactokinase